MVRVSLVMFIVLVFSLFSLNIGMAYEEEIKTLSGTMAENIEKAGYKTVAVVDFTDLQGSVTELGRFLAEEFSVALASAGKGFEVVDRIHLKSIIQEHKLSLSGLMDPQTARKVGQIAGVDVLLTGTITPFGDNVRISVKVLHTTTAKIIGASTGNIAKTKAIEELLARGVAESGGTSSTVGVSPSQTPTGGKPVEAQGFTFTPVFCKRSYGKAVCRVSFLNTTDKEVKLYIYASSSVLSDNLGNQYRTEVKIGSYSNTYNLERLFFSQIPTNVDFIAQEDVSVEATHMTLAISIGEFSQKVVLRNIPISK